jgi:DNA polymerase I-like protein with 3'-5' exonuclease and polymerase domains
VNSESECSPKHDQLSEGAGAASTGVALVFPSGQIPYGWQAENLRTKLLRAGLDPLTTPIITLNEIASLKPTTVIVGFGESVLRALSEKRGIDKWHLSPFVDEGMTLIPTFDLARANKQFELNLYIEVALRRAKEFSIAPPTPHPERFLLNPPLEETYAILRMLESAPEVAVDVETGYGQINTVGFAWSPSDAIAINVLPERCHDDNYFELWKRIRAVLESPSRKIFQNFIYDTSYFSAYGVMTRGEIYDTMHAMRVLWPELDVNLGNVGRMYTRRVYWKDDGKVEHEEGKKKDWGNVRDWTRHYIYNCRDTTGTFEASSAQREDLTSRQLDGFYSSYIQSLIDPVREMVAVGFPVCPATRDNIAKETEARVEGFVSEFAKKVGEVSPTSPKQVLTWLKREGIAIPKKYDKASGSYKETTDAAAIKKIRLKRDLPGLRELQEIKSLKKALSSYIKFEMRPDGRLSYSLNITGTETLRWSGGKDPWGRGFNIQTIPREGGDVSIKSMFLAPEGHSFLEVDLRQAESRFVAYRSADKTLIDMLESGADVHSHVGHAILRQIGKDSALIPPDEFKSTWRQLGKKAGHGLNYGMKARVFVETVFNELDMAISVKDAEAITAAYYGLFPGIPRWHAWVRNELYTKRRLVAPSGWERYFYNRPGDEMFKEGCAWEPQHTIPWITNHLMLYLHARRKSGMHKFNLLTQVHDSLIMLVPDANLKIVALDCLNHQLWHPLVELPGGVMQIPTEVKAGRRMSELTEIELG